MSISNDNEPSYIQALTGWNDGTRSWTGNAGQSVTVRYSFDNNQNFQGIANTSALDDLQKAAVITALNFLLSFESD